MSHWKARRTLLLVGEGHSEVAFLKHVKSTYAPRGCGLSVTVKNAGGKGAKGVVEWTIRQIALEQHDKVAVLLDTDTDWSGAVEKKARSKKIVVLKSEPCFEAMMLRLLRKSDSGDTRSLKARFAPFVNHDSLCPKSYAEHFDRNCLESGVAVEPTIKLLLGLFE